MDTLAARTGRQYHLVDYYGAPDADRVIVAMASGNEAAQETVDYLNAHGEKVGLLKIRLYRPFDMKRFVAALPKSIVIKRGELRPGCTLLFGSRPDLVASAYQPAVVVCSAMRRHHRQRPDQRATRARENGGSTLRVGNVCHAECRAWRGGRRRRDVDAAVLGRGERRQHPERDGGDGGGCHEDGTRADE